MTDAGFCSQIEVGTQTDPAQSKRSNKPSQTIGPKTHLSNRQQRANARSKKQRLERAMAKWKAGTIIPDRWFRQLCRMKHADAVAVFADVVKRFRPLCAIIAGVFRHPLSLLSAMRAKYRLSKRTMTGMQRAEGRQGLKIKPPTSLVYAEEDLFLSAVFVVVPFKWSWDGFQGEGGVVDLVQTLPYLLHCFSGYLGKAIDGKFHVEIVPDGFAVFKKPRMNFLIVTMKFLNFIDGSNARQTLQNIVIACVSIPKLKSVAGKDANKPHLLLRAALAKLCKMLLALSGTKLRITWRTAENRSEEAANVAIQTWLGGDQEMQHLFIGTNPNGRAFFCSSCVTDKNDGTITPLRTVEDKVGQYGKIIETFLAWILVEYRILCTLHSRMSHGRSLERAVISLCDTKASEFAFNHTTKGDQRAAPQYWYEKVSKWPLDVSGTKSTLEVPLCGHPSNGQDKYDVNGKDAMQVFEHWSELGDIFGRDWQPFAVTVKPVADFWDTLKTLAVFRQDDVGRDKWLQTIQTLSAVVAAFAVVVKRDVAAMPYLHLLAVDVPRLREEGGELDRLGFGLGAFSADANESQVGVAKRLLQDRSNKGGGKDHKQNLGEFVVKSAALAFRAQFVMPLAPHLQNTMH